MKQQGKLGRVMLIDDEEIDQMIYKRVLTRSGLTDDMISFTSAEMALSHLHCHPLPDVDLILLDINMPCMNGLEFLEAVQAQIGEKFDIPIIVMLTIPLSRKDQKHVASFDLVKAFVNKPLNTHSLNTAITALEDKRAA